jgi:Domain of unknown function (DUF4430)
MRGRGTAVAIALLLGGAAIVAAGCGLGAGAGVGKVDLTVTREFGAVKVSHSSGEANESDTVMRFLEGQDEIETRYGGGYVKSIDGIAESQHGGHPYDWFFYVNGVESPIGAAEVSLEGGEQVWWDDHNWGATDHIPAVVGSWPAPFTTGWEGHAPVVAVECDGGGAACGEVTAALEGEGVRLASAGGAAASGDEGAAGEEVAAPKGSIRVLVGPWAKLRSDPAAALIEKGPGESGVYAKFVGASGGGASGGSSGSASGGSSGGAAGGSSGGGWSLVGLDEDGEEARRFGAAAGLVAATRHYEGPPVWVVTGATGAAVRAAAASLTTADLRDHFAVASEAGTAVPLPLRTGSG